MNMIEILILRDKRVMNIELSLKSIIIAVIII